MTIENDEENPRYIDAVAAALDTAQFDAVALTDLDELKHLDLDEAYQAQHLILSRRIARGESLSGVKLGFTSEAKMAQMGVDELIVGQLTDAMRVEDDGTLDLAGFIHPRVEPEIAFRLSRDVDPTDPTTDLWSAIDGVAAALEVIDSRYEGFSFTLPGVVADNTSAAAYAIGTWHPTTVDLADVPISIRVADELRAEGSTAAILGNPLNVLPRLVTLAARYGLELTEGSVILAGAATAATALNAGKVEAHVAGLGSVSFRAVGGVA